MEADGIPPLDCQSYSLKTRTLFLVGGILLSPAILLPHYLTQVFQISDNSLSTLSLTLSGLGEMCGCRVDPILLHKPSHTHRRFLLLPKQTLLHQKEKNFIYVQSDIKTSL